jgi:hypothetical protein|tara:strand:- start:182 stop:340 length:159 start_codon:yes stop_codon:yes gene_type:complete
MKEVIEALEDKSVLMKEIIPERQHRIWKKSYLNKTAYEVLLDINEYQRRNKK